MATRLWTIELGDSEGKVHAIPEKWSIYIRNWERTYAAFKIRRLDKTLAKNSPISRRGLAPRSLKSSN